MRNKFLKALRAGMIGTSVLLGLLSSTAEVSAEQAAAEHYRQLIESGRFYIEYQGNNALAFDGDRRVSYAKYQRVGDRIANGINLFYHNASPVYKGINESTFFKDHKENKLKIEALYQNGKYYQFFSNNKALRAEEESLGNLKNPNDTLNQSEGWDQVKMALNLPEFLEALVPNHPQLLMNSILNVFDSNKGCISECVRSDTEQIDGKTFNVDRYVVTRLDIKTSETSPDQNSYSFYYDEAGTLKYVKEETRHGHKHGDLISIEEFCEEIPSGFFDFPKGCKVYESDSGGMGDLLGQPTLVEKH